jgi:GH35 family endo-1,4-beta-xylanase
MAPLPVRVTSGGAPVEGAAVRIRMQRHAFGFGTAVAAQQLLGTGADSDTYRSKLLELFNKAVLENDLKWPTWERNRQPALDALAWLRANGIADVRGHNIIWPGWQYLPADLRNLAGNPGAMRARVDARVTDVVTATRGQLTDWDVVNEPIPNRDIQNVLGDQELGRWFQMAHAADRDARLFLNEYSILSGGGRNRPKQDLYYQMIRDLLDQGAPVGGIGIQGHFGTDATQPERVIEILDRFAELGLPIQITEFDVNTLDEQFQADYLRDFTTLCFSHPRVDAFLMWGFWAGRHWLPEAALYRRDWSEKPNAVAWRKLLFDEWWTNADGTTSAAGEFKVRAFLGEYAIEVEHAGKIVSRRVTLVRDGEPVVVSLDE